MVWLFRWLDEESSSGEFSGPYFRSIGQFLFGRLLSSLVDSALMSGFSWVTVLVWCLLLFCLMASWSYPNDVYGYTTVVITVCPAESVAAAQERQSSIQAIYLSICLSIYGSLLCLGRFFSFLIFYTVGKTSWTGDQPISSPLPAHRTVQTQNKRAQTYIPRVGFEPTIPAFERTKRVHVLDSAATVVGYWD
jgi:hypothetical protein